MKRGSSPKFPHSVHLFKFCQKVLYFRKNKKPQDQDIGMIINFNPSDCSHWKRGEKNIKSVFSLSKIASALQVDSALIYDIANSDIGVDEAYYEFVIAENIKESNQEFIKNDLKRECLSLHKELKLFADRLHAQVQMKSPPLYIPEVMNRYPFVSTQLTEITDKLSRIIKAKPGQFLIQYRKGDLKPQTRMSIVQDLAKILIQGGTIEGKLPLDNYALYQQITLVAHILLPMNLLKSEMQKVDSRNSLVMQLSSIFWVPKFLVNFQLQQLLLFPELLSVSEQERKTAVPEEYAMSENSAS